MVGRRTREQLLEAGEIVAPPVERACTDQSFELPAGLYAAMAAMFTGFVAVLGLAFRGGHMGVAVGVIFAFIAAFFAVPAAFPGMAASTSRSRSLDWFEFSRRGIHTATGHSSAGEATVLVLLLPFLILCFGIAVVTISAWMS
ncbi:MAG: hypothetical protein ACM3ZV_12755 [Bacillota bacterium]